MKRIPALILTILLALPLSAQAADLMVGQAANFMPAMKEIIPAFKKETGLEVQATYTSTGKLYAQIVNGAPYDIFLAADERRPSKLFADALAEKPFVTLRVKSFSGRSAKILQTKAGRNLSRVETSIK